MNTQKTIYCMDLGTGTIDLLLRDPAKLTENQTRIVAPSPALVHMDEVYQAPGPIFVRGHIVGGGPFAKALIQHAKKHRTVLHPSVSAIVKNSCSIVTGHGLEISEEIPEGATVIEADELRIRDHEEILARLGEPRPEGYAVAVQDHGGSDDGLPDRVHRFSEFKSVLTNQPRLVDFAFTKATVPAPFRRMRAGAEYLESHLDGRPYILMDTVFAGLLGCYISLPPGEGIHLLVNVGNSHTTAALVQGETVLGLFEHHTKVFKKKPELLPIRLDEFARSQLTEDGVREDGGCGVWYLEPGREIPVQTVRCSGPRREILAGRALPGGNIAERAFQGVDAMMVGPLGLAAAFDATVGSPKVAA